MPWKASEATRFTKKATTAKKKRQFSHIANSALKRGYSEGRAIQMASGVLKRESGGKKIRGRRKTSRG